MSAGDGEGEGTAILPGFVRSSFPFPSPSDACHAGYKLPLYIVFVLKFLPTAFLPISRSRFKQR